MAAMVPEGIVSINTHGSIYPEVTPSHNLGMDKYERLQALLLGVKDHYCDGNAAELARQIGRSPSYVNRLFYERSKSGAKGIGPDIMEACSAKFDLPRGFWEMEPAEAFADRTEGDQAVDGPAAQRDILSAVETLRTALRASNRPTRISLVPLLTELVKEPGKSGDIAQHVAFLLGRAPQTQKSPEDQPAKKVGRDIRASLDKDANANGTSDSAGKEEERRSGMGGVSGGDAR